MARTQVQRIRGTHFRRTKLRTSNRQTKSRLKRLPPPSISSCPTRSPQPFQGYKAKPITPPQSAGVPGSYRCIVDSDHQPFSIIWSGSAEYPDLANLPVLKNVDILPVHQSSEIAAIWRDSMLLDYGSHASIRITKHGRFPILKLAHSDECL
ncbi:hypothetical protein B0O99DRAFT_274348 [Bisporella sp. PMI_857]|nr:hypothetical protein B0O99DRAFT_274348 [Bisporella sp. PMI_857]